MSKRVCVFVDGENFRHSITGLFDDFKESDYLPKNARWQDFFDWLVKEVCGDGTVERVRTYWYVIESIDFFPYRFHDAESKTETLQRLLSKCDDIRGRIDGLKGEPLVSKMKSEVEMLRKRRHMMRGRFEGWTTLQNGISSRHRSIEFRRAGAIRYNLFKRSLGPEKAVDVKLATDLLMLRDIYDVAVIVSGDQDYVPAVQVVKDFGKSVVNVAFKTRNGRLLPGGARRLNEKTDWSLSVDYERFREFLNIDGSES